MSTDIPRKRDERDVARIRKSFNGNRAMTLGEVVDRLGELAGEVGSDALIMCQSWPVSALEVLPKDSDQDREIVEVVIDMTIAQSPGYDNENDRSIP